MVVRAFLLALVFLFAPNSALGKRRATHGSKQLTLRSSTDIEQSQGAEAEFVVSTGLLIWAAVETYKAFDAASYRNDFKNSLVSNIDVALSDQPANDELSTAYISLGNAMTNCRDNDLKASLDSLMKNIMTKLSKTKEKNTDCIENRDCLSTMAGLDKSKQDMQITYRSLQEAINDVKEAQGFTHDIQEHGLIGATYKKVLGKFVNRATKLREKVKGWVKTARKIGKWIWSVVKGFGAIMDPTGVSLLKMIARYGADRLRDKSSPEVKMARNWVDHFCPALRQALYEKSDAMQAKNLVPFTNPPASPEHPAGVGEPCPARENSHCKNGKCGRYNWIDGAQMYEYKCCPHGYFGVLHDHCYHTVPAGGFCEEDNSCRKFYIDGEMRSACGRIYVGDKTGLAHNFVKPKSHTVTVGKLKLKDTGKKEKMVCCGPRSYFRSWNYMWCAGLGRPGDWADDKRQCRNPAGFDSQNQKC